jgi:prophage regulatory protein
MGSCRYASFGCVSAPKKKRHRPMDHLTSIEIQLEERLMPVDMLDRLILDPGSRTLGELLQEREWAVGEIRRLRSDVGRLSRKSDAVQIEKEMSQEAVDTKHLDPALNAQRLLRLAEVIKMIGLCRSSIYRYVAEGKFPAPINVGYRSVRWRLSDVLAWRTRVSRERDSNR